MHKVFLNIGGNIGNKDENFRKVYSMVQEKLGNINKSSSIYESPPWGFHAEENFWNQVFLVETENSSREFLLQHQLYLSDRTGRVIKDEFLKFPYPHRWKYNILRALDYFRHSGAEWDERMRAAADYILSKRRPDGSWNQMAKHPGEQHFEMEKAGKPGRWNTLIALRVLKYFDKLSPS